MWLEYCYGRHGVFVKESQLLVMFHTEQDEYIIKRITLRHTRVSCMFEQYVNSYTYNTYKTSSLAGPTLWSFWSRILSIIVCRLRVYWLLWHVWTFVRRLTDLSYARNPWHSCSNSWHHCACVYLCCPRTGHDERLEKEAKARHIDIKAEVEYSVFRLWCHEEISKDAHQQEFETLRAR